MMRVGFVGTGKIAGAMVHGLADQGHAIRVSPRSARRAADLAARFAEVQVAENPEVVAGSDIVIVSLMADAAGRVLPDLPWRSDQIVVSVMAGVARDALAVMCAPATRITLMIPLPSVATGGCPLPVFPACDAVGTLFGARNAVLPVDSEAALNAHFLVAGTAAPILRMLAEITDWLATETGDAVAAEAYVSGLFTGFLAPDGSGQHFVGMMAELATQGGLNATLRAALEAADTPAMLRAAMDDLRPRLDLPAAPGAQ